MLRLLHTSDWHIGRLLYGQKRYDEFAAFLSWLAETIVSKKIDILLVSGDIFDTTTPSNRSQKLYYQFLRQVSDSGLKHVVITAGNHDSPTFLTAPKELLKAFNVHVVGSVPGDLEDEVLCLEDETGNPMAIVCAVPYLRDRDVRKVAPGESLEDKGKKLLDGIRNHYTAVFTIAEKKQVKAAGAKSDPVVPVIAMGHLFATGGKTLDGDGVRELYVGSLARVGKEIFPDTVDYVALGHLHVPQTVGKADHVRYSGSPIAMGFGEARQQKSVVMVEFENNAVRTDLILVPVFQQLHKIKGTMEQIVTSIEELKSKTSTAWLEIEYSGQKIPGNLKDHIDDLVSGSGMQVLRIKNQRVLERVMKKSREARTLDDLSVSDVFNRLLDTLEIEADQRPGLTHSYQEIIRQIDEADMNEE